MGISRVQRGIYNDIFFIIQITMKNYLILLCMLALVLVCSSAKREQKQFSLFSIVSFKQESCSAVSTSGVKGVCMTSSECNNLSGGTADGNCAASFGVCCVISISTCGSSISQNCSYIENPGYPSTYSTTGDCSYTVSRCQDDICQIRLDFFAGSLQQPSTAAATCTDTILDITAGTTSQSFTTNPPNLCGNIKGQHLYIDSGRAATAATLKFTLATSETNTWKIKVTQIECWNPSKAPEGCMQYFYGSNVYTVTSFNWDGSTGCTSGCIYNNQQYNVCFRGEKGMCGSQISVTPVSSSLDAFQLGSEEAIEFAETTYELCGEEEFAFLLIHGIDSETGDSYCGDYFSTVGAEAITGDRATANGSVLTSGSDPFKFMVVAGDTDQASDGSAGFSLDVAQVACGQP